MDVVAAPPERSGRAAREGGGTWADYGRLMRPRIVGMVLLTMLATAVLAAGPHVPWVRLAHALAGSTLVIVGAIALNQRLEMRRDARMSRTAARPLPQGRLSPTIVSRLAAGATALGLIYLALAVNGATTLLAAASWLIYVWVYTPLKPLSVWQTPVGAVAGAMPTLLGAGAVDGLHDPLAWTLFGVLYLWQIPHSMAIAWMYRGDFAAAEVRLATIVEPSGRAAGAAALLAAVCLIPVSLVPVACCDAGLAYAVIVSLLGSVYAVVAWAFLLRRDDLRASRLLRVSLVYLPLLLAELLVARLG